MFVHLARGEQAPWLSLVSLKIFFFSLGSLPLLPFGLLNWGHLIFGNIINLTSQTLFDEKLTELDDDIPVLSRAAL